MLCANNLNEIITKITFENQKKIKKINETQDNSNVFQNKNSFEKIKNLLKANNLIILKFFMLILILFKSLHIFYYLFYLKRI